MWVWTKPGHKVQTLSKLCPKFVHGLSMVCPCPNFVNKNDFSPVFVQPLSKKGLVFVQRMPTLSKLFGTGQTLDKIMSRICPHFVHQNRKSKRCPMFVHVYPGPKLVQTTEEWTKLRQIFVQILSIVCPYFVH